MIVISLSVLFELKVLLLYCIQKQSEIIMNIFVVYSSWYIGATISFVLSKVPDGYIIGESRQAKTAIRLMSEKRPEIVIIDAELSNGMWEEVLEWSKGLLRIPLIIMIGPSGLPQYRATCLERGADYFFELPSEIECLRKTISEFIHFPLGTKNVKLILKESFTEQ